MDRQIDRIEKRTDRKKGMVDRPTVRKDGQTDSRERRTGRQKGKAHRQ